MSKLEDTRKERLTALAEKYYIPIPTADQHCRSASEEDLQSYLYGEWHIDRWAAVTYHDDDGSGTHFLKTFPEREGAEEYTVEYVSDDIFTETPIAVVDLDDPIEPHGKIYGLKKLIPIFEGS